jgi:hypothetical protein
LLLLMLMLMLLLLLLLLFFLRERVHGRVDWMELRSRGVEVNRIDLCPSLKPFYTTR